MSSCSKPACRLAGMVKSGSGFLLPLGQWGQPQQRIGSPSLPGHPSCQSRSRKGNLEMGIRATSLKPGPQTTQLEQVGVGLELPSPPRQCGQWQQQAGVGEEGGRKDVILSMEGKRGKIFICFGDLKSVTASPVAWSTHPWWGTRGERLGTGGTNTYAALVADPSLHFAKSWIHFSCGSRNRIPASFPSLSTKRDNEHRFLQGISGREGGKHR